MIDMKRVPRNFDRAFLSSTDCWHIFGEFFGSVRYEWLFVFRIKTENHHGVQVFSAFDAV